MVALSYTWNFQQRKIVDVDVFVSLLIFICAPLQIKPNKASDFVLFMAVPQVPSMQQPGCFRNAFSSSLLYLSTLLTDTLPLIATPLGAFKKGVYVHHMKINQLSENISKL